MELFTIETGNLMLDGGAMFGVVPKVLWQKSYPANEKNLVNLSMRAMLISTNERKILIDNGIGDKQDAKFLGHYYLNGEESLIHSLRGIGIEPTEITDVIMTHLHFDHCGGGTRLEKNQPILTFPNAWYYCSHAQWQEAMNPNAREQASFLEENLLPIEQSGKLKWIEKDIQFIPGVELRLYNGHTRGQIIPFITINNKTLVYVADLIPSVSNIPLSWITAYDIDPLTALTEKEQFLNEAWENDYTLFFEHDMYHECCSLTKTSKGIRVGETFRLNDFLHN